MVRRIEVESPTRWRALDAGGNDVGALRTDTAAHDSTGGMSAKVEEAVRAAAGCSVVRIVEAGTPHALAACVEEVLPEGWVGTEVRAVG